MKILWVTGQWFEPEISGIFKYSSSMYQLARELGHEIVVVCRDRSTDAPRSDDYVALRPIRRARIPIGLALGQPVKVATVDGRDFRNAVRDQQASFAPDVVVIDHLRTATAIDAIDNRVPVIYLSQNNEFAVRKSSVDQQGRGLRYLALRLDQTLLKRSEQHVVDRASLTTTVTQLDADLFTSIYGVDQADVMVLPPVHTGPADDGRIIDASAKRRIVLATNVGWSLKAQNTEDILLELAPLAEKAKIEIVVSGPGQDKSALPKQFPTVDFVGFVDDLPELLRSARIGLIHDPRGGGIKIKALDYAFNRLPIASLPVDLAGLPLTFNEDTIGGTTAVELAHACVAAIDDIDRLNRLQQHAFDQCSAVFSREAVRNQLDAGLTRATRRTASR